jgi:uncharacterized protein with GYD domain
VSATRWGSGRKEERPEMPTYVSLFNWTDQGIRNVRDTVQRYERSQELQDKHGVRLEQIYWTIGPHDLVAIAEAADEESITAFFLELASAGNLRTTTLRAYDRDEMSGILGRIG